MTSPSDYPGENGTGNRHTCKSIHCGRQGGGGDVSGSGRQYDVRGKSGHVTPSYVAPQALLHIAGQKCHPGLPKKRQQSIFFCVNFIGSSIQLKKPHTLGESNKACLQSRCDPQATTLQSLEGSFGLLKIFNVPIIWPIFCKQSNRSLLVLKGQQRKE